MNMSLLSLLIIIIESACPMCKQGLWWSTFFFLVMQISTAYTFTLIMMEQIMFSILTQHMHQISMYILWLILSMHKLKTCYNCNHILWCACMYLQKWSWKLNLEHSLTTHQVEQLTQSSYREKHYKVNNCVQKVHRLANSATSVKENRPLKLSTTISWLF